ncbi:hypothetical protein BO94DRAFT_324936 [Aspergillus sclerotioniger CBS 115572]|uniref:Secreted protein n=1 Tax=Aspergillus sclerotioniger CBS 115572 TaxID=1450535 RepID=A0A317X982_9EURO|nr:hypothetical protein BO94DRAFT_324936 [Aspergillus sclerotioniger CBS 115572]PWY94212.1 hypothetical protein BO94DRAFT_324936 [Aspergillus sclerotioniger CBS 115572]
MLAALCLFCFPMLLYLFGLDDCFLRSPLLLPFHPAPLIWRFCPFVSMLDVCHESGPLAILYHAWDGCLLAQAKIPCTCLLNLSILYFCHSSFGIPISDSNRSKV